MDRKKVYELIDGEREYQELLWNFKTTISGGLHSPEEWLVYMLDYVHQGMHIASRHPKAVSDPVVMEIIRKIAAMGVSAMEQHDTKPRRT